MTRPHPPTRAIRPPSRPAGRGGRCMLAAVAAALAAVAAAAGDDLVGTARIVDGRTLEIGGARVRLFAIEAPALDEACPAAGGSWPCGRDAMFALAFEAARHWLRCRPVAGGEDRTIVAVCHVGPHDLGRRMLRLGWARALPAAPADYADAERAARADGRGLWRGLGPAR